MKKNHLIPYLAKKTKHILELSRTRMTKIVDVVYVNNVILTVGCERVRGVKAKLWDSCWQTRDKCGWVFITTSKEAGSSSK
jgi:hypothetical protein